MMDCAGCGYTAGENGLLAMRQGPDVPVCRNPGLDLRWCMRGHVMHARSCGACEVTWCVRGHVMNARSRGACEVT